MSCNFKISAHRNSDSLHLKLEGDFDGSSALALINYLKKNIHKNSKVFIHTNCLEHIYPFGSSVFQANFDFITRQHVSFVFTGKNVVELVPERNKAVCIVS